MGTTTCSLPWTRCRSAAPGVAVCYLPLRLRINLASLLHARLQAIARACAKYFIDFSHPFYSNQQWHQT